MRILIFLVALSLGAQAQMVVSVDGGYGFYSMSEMKSLQNAIANNFTLPPKTISSFPAYWSYELSFRKLTENHLVLGFTMNYNSTGGRLSYSDYSGNEGSDQLLRSYSFSTAIGGWRGFSDNRWLLQYELRPGFTSSRLDFSVYETLPTGSDQASASFRSINLFVQPVVGLTRRMGPLGINCSVGYYLTVVYGKQKTGNGYLINGQSTVHADWSGLRLQAGLSYFLD